MSETKMTKEQTENWLADVSKETTSYVLDLFNTAIIEIANKGAPEVVSEKLSKRVDEYIYTALSACVNAYAQHQSTAPEGESDE